VKTKDTALIAVILIIAGSIYLFTQNKPIDHTKPVVCIIQEPDPNGYLLKICKYLREHNDTISPNKAPDNYSIKRIEEGGEYGAEMGNDTRVVKLDCCGTGDLAFIDKETNEVKGFSPGDL
jgi:hypothetical protein